MKSFILLSPRFAKRKTSKPPQRARQTSQFKKSKRKKNKKAKNSLRKAVPTLGLNLGRLAGSYSAMQLGQQALSESEQALNAGGKNLTGGRKRRDISKKKNKIEWERRGGR